jgi:UDP:flavonoid glycosyltransferase YjiC (YdhE family)
MGPLIERSGLVLTSGTSAPVLAALRALDRASSGSPASLQSALWSAWHDRGMRERAGELGRRLAAADSSSRAADVIEQVSAGRPSHEKPRPGKRPSIA